MLNQQHCIFNDSRPTFISANEQSFYSSVWKPLSQDSANFIHIVKLKLCVSLQVSCFHRGAKILTYIRVSNTEKYFKVFCSLRSIVFIAVFVYVVLYWRFHCNSLLLTSHCITD